MAEKNILAYFNTPEDAEGAASKLKALRAAAVKVDRIGEFPGSGIDHIENPITGDFPGLGYLTLGGDFSGNSSAILAAAHPDASGMADRSDGRPAGKDVLLTAVVDESIHHQALRVVEEAGGLV
jgi:hypothetical protein